MEKPQTVQSSSSYVTLFSQVQISKMATHSSILAWRILWTEEPGRLQSIESQRVRRDWSDLTLTLKNLSPEGISLVLGLWGSLSPEKQSSDQWAKASEVIHAVNSGYSGKMTSRQNKNRKAKIRATMNTFSWYPSSSLISFFPPKAHLS